MKSNPNPTGVRPHSSPVTHTKIVSYEYHDSTNESREQFRDRWLGEVLQGLVIIKPTCQFIQPSDASDFRCSCPRQHTTTNEGVFQTMNRIPESFFRVAEKILTGTTEKHCLERAGEI